MELKKKKYHEQNVALNGMLTEGPSILYSLTTSPHRKLPISQECKSFIGHVFHGYSIVESKLCHRCFQSPWIIVLPKIALRPLGVTFWEVILSPQWRLQVVYNKKNKVQQYSRNRQNRRRGDKGLPNADSQSRSSPLPSTANRSPCQLWVIPP